ncbi:TKL protein kinase [Saprolegnia parasitica CBS 223.65]|uniref:TKL protein kinase n=1 Tax=Saprolegnia parasitica (strain CBS 223.65) TaxID=695850 RepID=A0A067BKY6_SAPPC|nr:TKL protein kinase [Saprolegnia parasitica CBS 223.65]KDO18853.1 TKL protein kinase [Saprolegnia parasitica CBS 223.65]|eukprot:XP_012210436.1 TKL protein kinase [Saprolegnia parasitica CBS 223.65]
MSLTTTCANKMAAACVVYGPGNETDLSLDSRGRLNVDAPVTSIESLPPSATALYVLALSPSLGLTHCSLIASSTLAFINPALGSTMGAASQLASISVRFNRLGESLNAVQWPQSLSVLDLTGNKMGQINASFSIPAKLRALVLSSNQITSIDGLVIPSSLQSLSLYVNTIDTFNINAASFAALSQVQLFTDRAIRALECKGTRQTFQGAVDPDVNGGRPLLHTACVLDASAAARPVRRLPYPLRSPPLGPATADASSADSGASTGLYAGVGIGAAVLILLLVGGLLRLRQRRRPDAHYLDHTTPSTDISRKPNPATETPAVVNDGTFAYTYDIRSDPELNGYRIPKRELLQKQICGNGGFAIVYKALFQDQVVAVKELQAVHTRHATHVQAFMHEIQLFSTLQHDNIVRFVGVSWTTLHDLALVTEFLPNGDLRDLLLRDLDTQSLHWTMPSDTFPVSKLQMAVNVIDAITYLHSFEPKILHRDLKSRNILLDATYVAKLTDFGISRLVVDETMTREAGTTAWTAPEVLLSDGHYNEKADVYSFGVVLSELDTWQVPYATSSSSQPMSSVQMALLVSTGKLTPTFRDDCPSDILALAKDCLAMDPDDRPTAAHVAYALRKLVRQAP